MNDLAGLAAWAAEALPLFAAAAVCGAMLGYERHRRHAAVGMKTYALVCVGATAYMLSGHQILATSGLAGDPSRMAGQIVTGIGFLGAGAILRGEDGGIRGLTSAAGIWVSGAVGVLIGCRLPLSGVVLAVFVVALLVLLSFLEARLAPASRSTTGLERDTSEA